MVGEGGGEEAVEGDTARVGDDHGEEAGNPNRHPLSLLLTLGSQQNFCFLIFVV